MIELIIDMLVIDDFRGKSKYIDTAKGINKLPTTFKEGWQQYKRKRAWL